MYCFAQTHELLFLNEDRGCYGAVHRKFPKLFGGQLAGTLALAGEVKGRRWGLGRKGRIVRSGGWSQKWEPCCNGRQL